MSHRVDLELVLQIIGIDLHDSLKDNGGLGKAYYIGKPKSVVDDTTKILIHNRKGKKVAVLICSYIKYSDLPERNLRYSQEIKHLLGPEIGDVILSPLLYGRERGVSYAVWPYCNPISRNRFIKRTQLYLIRKSIFRWLRNITQLTKQKPSPTELVNDFLIPLEILSKNKKISIRIRKEIGNTIRRLNEKKWTPYFILAHNDLWYDNFLLKKNRNNITIIDWAGAKEKSYAINDLTKIFRTGNFSLKEFRGELEEHCKILRCDLEDSKGYLLSSFAFLGENLDQFPENRYLGLVETSCNYLFTALDSK